MFVISVKLVLRSQSFQVEEAGGFIKFFDYIFFTCYVFAYIWSKPGLRLYHRFTAPAALFCLKEMDLLCKVQGSKIE